MIRTLQDLKNEFDALLGNIKGTPTTQFTKMTECAFEAVICAKTINEYAKIYGTPITVTNPVTFLNQKPGKFDPSRAFKVEFIGTTYYFAADVECYGLSAMNKKSPVGDIFEADVVVIHENHIQEIATVFLGNPAPQHLHAAYECKFGAYHKSQLRELLGFRRHISYLNRPHIKNHVQGFPYKCTVASSNPDIQVILFRPTHQTFLQPDTASMYDLHQQVYP